MQRVTLQIPMTKKLKDSAELVAEDYGFSSLQEAVRVLLTKLAKKQLAITVEENVEYLTPAQERVLTRKYNQARKEIESGKGFVAHSVEEMMKQLRS